MKITRLKIAHMENPMGIDDRNPVCSWNVEGTSVQTKYRIQARGDLGSTWDSGICLSSDMSRRIDGEFQWTEHVTVTLSVWDQNGSASAAAEFELAKDPHTWEAVWVNPEMEIPDKDAIRPASYLMKKFHYQGSRKVRLYATAHGVYNVYINGTLIRDFIMAPGTSEYDKILQFQTYDISEYLKEGDNEIIVSLGNGWWRGRETYFGTKNGFGDDVAFLAEIHCDGKVICKTDASWLATQEGPIRDSDNMGGEVYDARREDAVFCEDKRSEIRWHNASEVQEGYENLACSNCPAPKEQEIFHPQLLIGNNGEKLLDFGQNFAGIVRFRVNEPEGTEITLLHGEVLDGDGNFQQENFQSYDYRCDQKITYIANGREEIYYPTTTFMGFRYILVEGMESVNPADFEAVAIYSDLEVTADFRCGDSLVNQLFSNSMWSLKGNLIDIPTDCPTREKSGFTGDLVTFLHTFNYFMDTKPMIEKFERNHAAKQFDDGCVKQVVGSPGGRADVDGSAGWSDSLEILPYEMDRLYVNEGMSAKYYESIKRWVDFNITRAAEHTRDHHMDNPYHKYLLDSGFHWGEWLEPGWDAPAYLKDHQENGDPEVATAYLSYAGRLLSEMADSLGNKEDEAYYREVSEGARQAYRYYFAPDGKISSDRMCRYVRPIALGLLDEEESKKAAADLNRLVEKNNDHLNTGFLTSHYLCRVLSDYGYADTAYRLLLQKDAPGWLYSVTQGATTITENWESYQKDGSRKESFNHYSYGAISGWLMDTVLGIRVENGTISLCPIPNQKLGFAEGEYISPFGRIRSSWKYTRNAIVYEFEIPANMTASLTLPGEESVLLSTGIYRIIRNN